MALALAGRGHDVAIHYLGSQAEAEATAAEARALGVNAHIFRADLLDEAQTQALILGHRGDGAADRAGQQRLDL